MRTVEIRNGVKIVFFSKEDVELIKTKWNNSPDLVRTNQFTKSCYDKVVKDKKLTESQWISFNSYLTTGKSVYEMYPKGLIKN